MGPRGSIRNDSERLKWRIKGSSNKLMKKRGDNDDGRFSALTKSSISSQTRSTNEKKGGEVKGGNGGKGGMAIQISRSPRQFRFWAYLTSNIYPLSTGKTEKMDEPFGGREHKVASGSNSKKKPKDKLEEGERGREEYVAKRKKPKSSRTNQKRKILTVWRTPLTCL